MASGGSFCSCCCSLFCCVSSPLETKVATTSDLMLAYVDFFLGGDEKRADLPPRLHQRFPLSLVFGGDGSYMTLFTLHRDKILTSLINQGSDFFTEEGMPRTAFPNGWKGENGLYTVGFIRRGLLGTASDAIKIAKDVADQWKINKEWNNNTSSSYVIF
ncbi:putative indole-3-pyruvate monooxygenase YUCCA9 isoform X1 [Apium graveolens]|uniref:putative indole-3-pyruvate monooxygenase YUCCA9 isoform X1 n=1 Tax=Apium graveolens TaxID=4045 RepID=UPI003D7B98A9